MFILLQIKDCWKFNPAKNIWTIYSKAIFGRNNFPSTVYKNKIYFGGFSNSEVFDPVNNLWSQWPSSSASYGFPECLLTWHDTFLLFGGEPAEEQKRVQSFNHLTQLWTELDRSSEPMNIFMSGCEVLPNHNVLIVGGSNPYQKSAVLYNVKENKWISVQDTQFYRQGTTLVKLSNRVFAIGGIDSGTETIEEFVFADNTWVEINVKLIIPREAFHSSLAVPAYLFAHMDGDCEGIV